MSSARPGIGGGGKFDHLIKLLLIGDSGVGKSCLLLRYSDSSFTQSFITTIGIDFKIKTLKLGGDNGKKLKLQIWDTAGQERFRTITTAYYRGAMGILLVYDVTDRNSFSNVKNWIRQIEQHASENVDLILVGNKCDADDEDSDARKVSQKEGEELAKEYNIPFIETSAKSNIRVDDCFETIAKNIVDRLDGEAQQQKENEAIELGEQKAQIKSSCCSK